MLSIWLENQLTDHFHRFHIRQGRVSWSKICLGRFFMLVLALNIESVQDILDQRWRLERIDQQHIFVIWSRGWFVGICLRRLIVWSSRNQRHILCLYCTYWGIFPWHRWSLQNTLWIGTFPRNINHCRRILPGIGSQLCRQNYMHHPYRWFQRYTSSRHICQCTWSSDRTSQEGN